MAFDGCDDDHDYDDDDDDDDYDKVVDDGNCGMIDFNSNDVNANNIISIN